MSVNDLRLRRAAPNDRDLLRRWDAAPHVVAAKGTEDWQWERELARELAWRQQLIAELDGVPFGFLEITDPARDDEQHWGDCAPGLRAIDIWIGEADLLGRGLGTRMLQLALERCFADPCVQAALVDPLASNDGARRFYQRQGFRFVSQRRFGTDDCAVYRLDYARFRARRLGPDTLETQRLLLRPWRDADGAPFAAINADPRVVRYLSPPLTPQQSDALMARILRGFVEQGFGLWAAERVDISHAPFIGFVGLSVPSFEAHFTPCVEIGWRLSSGHWGLGLATEAAREVLRHAFDELRLNEVVAFTTADNRASRRVMEKIGMRHDPAEDFDHPALPHDHRLRRHVLYRCAKSALQTA